MFGPSDLGPSDPRTLCITSSSVIITSLNVMPDNPFVYGEIVPAAAFVGRDVELDRLTTDLASGQKVFLISPRRYGKSSLVRQAAAALAKRRIATLEFTVSSFSSYVAFLEGYARALVSLETRAAQARSWLRVAVHHRHTGDPRGGRCRRRRVAGVSVDPHPTRRRPARRGGLRAAGAHRRPAGPAPRRRARRIPGHRDRSTAAASSRRSVPPSSSSGRSATCSRVRSRR